MELDLRGNEINEASTKAILKALSENFVLSELKLDIQLEKIPDGFSSYPLQSMFSFDFTKEEINLKY